MSDIAARKADHVRLALATATNELTSPFADVALLHEALPEVDLAAVDRATLFLGRRLQLPLVIASMTGGHPEGARINRDLANVADRHGIAMGVGSQRAALVDAGLRASYSAAREAAPEIVLYANVGAAQLVDQIGTPALHVADVKALIEMIAADGLIIHLNALQETVQPEGDRDARGWVGAIARIVAAVAIPVIVKETGGGIGQVTAARIAATGAAAIDVGGRGGTSFVAVETARAAERGDIAAAALGAALGDWGIPTPASIVLAARAGLPVVATGGVRSGVDAGKAIALGASVVGVARPLLQAVQDGGVEAGSAWVERFAQELATTMFLTGSADLAALRRAPVAIGSEIRAWLRARPAAEYG
jgi:isopentenyl-diphosphate delta-isomerase